MGLLSHYVAYRIGKRRERKEWESYVEVQESRPRNTQCTFYEDLCRPRGSCPRETIYECVYDED